jgi:predicted transglutaminase-like cysteine proteinase
VKPTVKAAAGLAVLLACSAPAAASSPSLFGSVEFRAQSLAALPQWQRTLARIEQERPVYDSCARSAASCPSRGVLAWQSLVKGQIGRARIEQLSAVNQFFNNWR